VKQLNLRSRCLRFFGLRRRAVALASLSVTLLTAALATSGTNNGEQSGGVGPRKELSASRNRLSGTIGTGGVAPLMGVDGHFGGGGGVLGRLGYGFQIFRGLELGAEIGYWESTTDGSALHVLLPGVVLRPYIPFGKNDSGEVALHLHASLSSVSIADVPGAWFGFGYSAGPDVRFWVDQTLGVHIGAEVFSMTGHNSAELHPHGFYLDNDGRVLALALWFGVVARF